MANGPCNIHKKTLIACTFVTAFLFLLSFSIPTHAQNVGANLSGTVTDPSGAVIPNASVTITNTATGVTTHAVTNTSGFYIAHNLLPGNYRVTISAAGFRTAVTTGLVLTVGARQVLNKGLTVGAAAQKVTITAHAQTVQLQSVAISGEISTTAIRQLPLNARSWTALAILQPGVNQVRQMAAVGSPDRLGRGMGQELTVAGQRPQGNNYLLNGISINDYSGQAPGNLLGGNLGVDAVQEFRVLTTDYSAEYGRSAGGVITAITKSGTNQFHGSAYEFLRNNALDAQPYFNVGRKPPFRRNQFGASAGGRIIKDKAFIFGDYEGLRQFQSVSSPAQVFSDAARGIGTGPGGGPGPSVIACSGTPLCGTDGYGPGRETLLHYAADNGFTIPNPDPMTGIDKAVLPFINAFYPKPNGGLVGSDPNAAIYNFNGFQKVSENFFTTRFDFHASSKDTVSAVYLIDRNPGSQTDEFGNKLILNKILRQDAMLEETHLFGSNVVNIFRAGYNREFAAAPGGAQAINPLTANTSGLYSSIPGDSAVGVQNVPDLTDFSGGLSFYYPGSFALDDIQGYDNVAITRGINSITFGANLEHFMEREQTCGNCAGHFEFNDIPSFLGNQPSVWIGDVSGQLNHYLETIFGTFFQDSIQVRRNLTVNAGLRYEFDTVPTEIKGRAATLYSISSPTNHTGNPLTAQNPTIHDFEPRVGFAWDPFSTGKTSIRAGFGIYDVVIIPTSFRGAFDSAYPFTIDYTVSNPVPGSFPSGAFKAATLLTGTTANGGQYVQQNPRRNYQMNWSVDIQRAIFPNTTVMLAYLGSRGVHDLFQTDDSDMVLPLKLTKEGYLWPVPNTAPIPASGVCPDPMNPTPTPSGCPWPRINPYWSSVATILWNGDNYYHAFEAALTQRVSHGMTAQVSYTYGQSTDTSSGSTDGDQFLNGITSLWYFSEALRKGPSDFNVPNNFTASFNYDLPSASRLPVGLKWAASGWALGTIFTAQNGTPFTVTFPNNSNILGQNSSDTWDYVDLVPGCNPIHGGLNYLNLSCFTLPKATPDIAALCTPFPGHPGTCMNLIGNSGRNSIRGPNIVDWDLSVHKNNYIRRISENFNIQFRAEFFNVLNHPNFVAPVDNAAVLDANGNPIAGAGTIDSTIQNEERQIQFALRIDW